MSLLRKILQKLLRHTTHNTLPPTTTPPPPFLFRVLHSGSPTVPATTTFDAIEGSLLPRNPSAAATLTSAQAHLARQKAPTPFLSLCTWEAAKRFVGVLKKEKASEICVLGFETGGWVGDGEGGGGGRVFCVAEMGGGEGSGNGNGEGRNGNGGGNGGEVVNGGNGGGSNGGRSSRVGNGSVAMGGHHEGEWLLLGGYKAHEQALVMNLEGFDEVHMAKIELEQLEAHVCHITGLPDGKGVPERLFAIMKASANGGFGR